MKVENRVYNNSTGCYKIDIYVNGAYKCSTDQSKTLKIAKSKYAAKNPIITLYSIFCQFYRS